MSSDARVDDAIVRAGSVDYLDFWFVTKLVSDVLGGAEQARVHEVALDSIESLTREGRLRVGRCDR
jgi:hypothetical protein